MSDVETTDDTTASPKPSAVEAHGWPAWERYGQLVVFPAREAYLDLMNTLREEGYDMCVDLCGVDQLQNVERALPDGVVRERFEVVVNLLSLADRTRVRVRVQIPDQDATLPSVFRVWPGTEAMEREAWDMLGIAFSDHPDLTRILMPEDWEGHPLRKDFAQGRVPVQFKAPNKPGGTPRPEVGKEQR